jgi:pimeloyl-ACP methyl ester carboxylesterase
MTKMLTLKNGDKLAYNKTDGKSPGVIFLTGFLSDMTGGKAVSLEQLCKNLGHSFLRFDYRGHGASEGDFMQQHIGSWLDDALAVLDELTEGPQILVGSSMGGWIMTLVAMRRPERIKGMVGIAAGTDFTEDLIWANATDEMKDAWDTHGYFKYTVDSPEPFTYTLTKGLITEGRNHLLLGSEIPFNGAVHLIHGMQDEDVPWQKSVELAEALTSQDVKITLVKDGGHRLSEPNQIELLHDAVKELLIKV